MEAVATEKVYVLTRIHIRPNCTNDYLLVVDITNVCSSQKYRRESACTVRKVLWSTRVHIAYLLPPVSCREKLLILVDLAGGIESSSSRRPLSVHGMVYLCTSLYHGHANMPGIEMSVSPH